MADKAFQGALGILKVNGIIIGKAKNVRATETFGRIEVMGIGTIIPSEKPVTRWSGSLSASFIEFVFNKTGIPGAVKRIFDNVASQALAGNPSFEDQVVLDNDGVTLDIFKKVEDFIDPVTKIIRPKVIPYVTVRNLLIESDGFDLSEGALAGHDQQFAYLTPITFLN
jgi:polygalacturonase